MTCTPRQLVDTLLGALLVALPLVAWLSGQHFAVTVLTRAVILALAAVSLNLILGYGGMISFGHAVYLGVGGYTVGILAQHGLSNGFLHFGLAMAGSAVLACGIGALSLRTRGVYFIMITLAFAQLVYYIGVGLEVYGGDDGLTLAMRSDVFGLLAIRNKATRTLVLYYIVLACLGGTVYLLHRLIEARFGVVLQGTKSNDMRMQALGFPTYRYRLTAFVIAGALCGLAGALEANRAEFVSPAMMHWTRSGDLIVIVVLGGMGTIFGPLYGALAFLVLEELLSQLTEHWPVLFGVLLILIVLYARGGIDSLLGKRSIGHG
jgi:branched-chain amino acid transport system permease protein